VGACAARRGSHRVAHRRRRPGAGLPAVVLRPHELIAALGPHAATTCNPRARAAAAILWSKVTSAARIRCAIAILSPSAVLRLRSSRRKNAPAALTSAVTISSRSVALPVHMSKAEKPRRASSDVIFPVRTRRATAEANSAAARSLTIRTGVFARKNASARAVRASTIPMRRARSRRDRRSLLVFITKAFQKLAGILRRHCLPYAMLGKPVQVGGRHRASRLCDGAEHHDGMAVPRDHDLLTLEGAVD